MGNVCTIYRREIATYFNSPIAYIFIVLFVAILAFMFFIMNNFFGQPSPDIRDYFRFIPFIFAVFIPAVTMRLWSEEKRAGTVELLMTLPIRGWEIVLGKYLAAFTIIAISLLLTTIVPLTVDIVTDVDWGVVFAIYMGCLMIASVYIALGAWVSTFTHNQVVALLVSVSLSFLMSFVGYPPVIHYINKNIVEKLGSFLGWFGTFFHFQEFAKGLLNPVGFIYAASVTAFFLTLNHVFVEGRKF